MVLCGHTPLIPVCQAGRWLHHPSSQAMYRLVAAQGFGLPPSKMMSEVLHIFLQTVKHLQSWMFLEDPWSEDEQLNEIERNTNTIYLLCWCPLIWLHLFGFNQTQAIILKQEDYQYQGPGKFIF
jgi:hypothetical protein